MGREVGDPAVEPVPEPAVGVEVGRSVAHKTAPGDELVEATPQNIRLRKRILDANARKRAEKSAGVFAD